MKYKTFLAFALVAALGFTTCSVFAEELGAKPVNQENTEVLFGDLNDNDKVVELEDGGFLYGEATVTDENDPTFEPVEYNSFDDPNSITVKDAKKIIQEGSASNFARGSNVPDSSTKTLTLKPNSHYQSSEFSGTGWRFGGYFFKASSGSGTYLRWTSYKDAGRIGNYSEAVGTKNGSLQGTVIEKNQTQYVSRGGSGMIYYTYSPLQGTYYYVVNI